MSTANFTKDELEELFQMRAAWDDLSNRERQIVMEALLDLLVQFKRQQK